MLPTSDWHLGKILKVCRSIFFEHFFLGGSTSLADRKPLTRLQEYARARCRRLIVPRSRACVWNASVPGYTTTVTDRETSQEDMDQDKLLGRNCGHLVTEWAIDPSEKVDMEVWYILIDVRWYTFTVRSRKGHSREHVLSYNLQYMKNDKPQLSQKWPVGL